MSYKVKLTDEVVKKLSGWRLSSYEVREIRKGLDALSSHPKHLLIRVGPPYDALQYDLIITACRAASSRRALLVHGPLRCRRADAVRGGLRTHCRTAPSIIVSREQTRRRRPAPGHWSLESRISMNLAELPKQYDPQDAQTRFYDFWVDKGYFHADPASAKPPYCIVIPPPNVTGALHLGHALNNTLQDILIRWRRMSGDEVLWMPGTDHAGIATQAVVERRLFEETKKTRHDLGRAALVERIWAWKDEYEKRILSQLRLMGCSCDWDRTRFTLDEVCSRAVRRTFFNLFKAGKIFRGKRLVNWDTQLRTAVADDEIYYEEVPGHLWTIKYPVADSPSGEVLHIATTRPETMLGDTAVAVHPDDPRYKHLIGQHVELPLTGRRIPIIADGMLVDPAFGTGVVKVTPAHDPNDYQAGLRNKLPMINLLNPDGTYNENAGKYAGLDRLVVRKRVVADLKALDLLERVDSYQVRLNHSDRSKTPIEPYLSDQWFVRMGDDPDGSPGFASQAMDAVTSGRVKIHPERYAKSYLDWLGEKRDWCISRQLWWGHRIPIWHCETCTEDDLRRAFGEQAGCRLACLASRAAGSSAPRAT